MGGAGTGLTHLHDNRYVHNDVKAANILVFSSGPGARETAAIADLGVALGERNIPYPLFVVVVVVVVVAVDVNSPQLMAVVSPMVIGGVPINLE